MARLTFNSAMKLFVQKQHQALYELAVKALRENERNPLAFFFLGMVASEHGQHTKAVEFHAKASKIALLNTRYQAAYAKALITLGHKIEAKDRADIAAKLGTQDAFVADMIGTVYSRSGHHDLAMPLLKRATQINPKWPIFQFNLGASAQFTGDLITAKKAYKKAISLDPRFYQAWFSLVSLEKQSAEGNHLAKLEALFANTAQNADGQLLLGHAIAKTHEDIGQFPESFQWLKKAKNERKAQRRYNSQETQKVFNSAKTTGLGTPHAPAPKSEVTPVFIVGMPRTGTTLVDRILSSHSDMTSVSELDLFALLLEQRTQIGRMSGAPFFEAVRQLNLSEIGEIYQQEIRKLANGKSYLIDKTPMNFFFAELITHALPNARIVGLRRGAMDSCLSNYRQLFALNDQRFDYTFDLNDTASYFREFDALMAHWRKTLSAEQFMEIHYENIVEDQETQTRRLLGFCGLEWDPACLRFHENTSAVDSASSVQVRQPLYSGSIGRWKKYGDLLDGLKAALGDLANT